MSTGRTIPGYPFAQTPPALANLSSGKTYTQKNEAIITVIDKEYAMLDICPNQPGYVSDFWMTFIDNASPRTADGSIIKVYIDGETTPSMSFDVGMLLGHQAGSGRFNTDNIEFTGPRGTYAFRYPIPYKRSCLITITPKTADYFWSMVNWVDGVDLPWKLVSSSKTRANKTAYTTTDLATGVPKFLDLPSGAGNSGIVVWHSVCGETSTVSDATWQEVNIATYLDGIAQTNDNEAQFNSSGFEDYFKGSHYFQSGASSSRWQSLSYYSTGNVMVGVDLLALNGGVRFADGITIKTETGKALTPGTPTTGASLSWLVLYYIPYTAAPAMTYSTSGLTAAYDPTSISSLYQDSALTTPVTASGQVVGGMSDLSGNTRTATSSGTARPTYNATALNGTPGIVYDGTDDGLSVTASGGFLGASDTAVTYIAAVQPVAFKVFGAFLGNGTIAANRHSVLFMTNASGNSFRMDNAPSVGLNSLRRTYAGVPTVLTCRLNTATIELTSHNLIWYAYNGSYTGWLGNQAAQVGYFGRTSAGSDYGNVIIGRTLVYNRVLSMIELHNAQNWVKVGHGFNSKTSNGT